MKNCNNCNWSMKQADGRAMCCCDNEEVGNSNTQFHSDCIGWLDEHHEDDLKNTYMYCSVGILKLNLKQLRRVASLISEIRTNEN